MSLSVCLIVKNEEKVLRRCLNCVKKIADEIIVVDTGSTDKTIAIAKHFTKNIFTFVWCDDFSKARNYSFSKATCDYIMWIDADDIILDSEIRKINNLKKVLNKDVYMLKYISGTPDNQLEFFRERIIKNCQSAKWNGFIHETITPFGKIEFLDIKINHAKIEPKDPKRNLRIYNKHLQNGETLNAREMYYYSKELFYNNYYTKCIKYLKKYLKMPGKYYPNEIDAILTLSKCYELKNIKDKPLEVLLNNLDHIIPTSEYLCEIGNIHFLNNRIQNAIIFYKSALNTHIQNNGVFYQKEYYHFIPYLQLSVCYYYLGNMILAKHYHELAKQENPNHPLIINNEIYFN